jgi:hypothetical protein
MARVAAIKDFYEYALMIGALCKAAGHEVHTTSPPIDFEQVVGFHPDVLVVGLFRRRTAFNRPIGNPDEDIIGLASCREIEQYPAIKVKPILLLGNGIEELEVPSWVHYDVFLFFPDDMGLFLARLDELATVVKTRRKLSRYLCPSCGSRLTYTQPVEKNLFCPRCHTAVSLLSDTDCLYLPRGSQVSCPCRLDDLTPRPGESSQSAHERATGRRVPEPPQQPTTEPPLP